MKRRIIIFFFILLFAATLQAQTVDEIIDNYFMNSGGTENWSSLESMKVTGTLSQGGMQLEMIIFKKRPDFQRSEFRLQGQTIVQAFDGRKAWMINPYNGSSDPQYMPDEMTNEFTNDHFESEFLNYRQKGNQVELAGKDTVDGQLVYKVKLLRKNGDLEYYYFDSETFLPAMQAKKVKIGPAQGQEVKTYFSDYKKVDEFLLPFRIQVKAGGETVQELSFGEYLLNEAMDDSLFSVPLNVSSGDN